MPTTTMPISISVTISTVVSTVVKHLAVIGKRARNTQGQSMFSDFTMTDSEKAILADLVRAGAESIVNQLSPFCSYTKTSEAVFGFKITTTRWKDGDTDNNKDITEALKDAIDNYLYNYTLGQYLSIIHPSTGEKYPPLYGTTYNNHCAIIIQNIIGICNVKRTPTPSAKTYADIKGLGDTATLKIIAIEATLGPEQVVSNASIYINNKLCADGTAEVPTCQKASYIITAPNHIMKIGEYFVTEDVEVKVKITREFNLE